ncbi:MAG: choice-of-anchor D domain-containing protein [Archangium sp.]|nr:choice-of-anchor D domain-containing protein [Archangium sp.]
MKNSLRLALGCLLATGCVVSFDPGAPCRTNEDCPDKQFCVATGVGDERRCALADSMGGGAAGGGSTAGGSAGSMGGGSTAGGSTAGGSTAGGAAGGAAGGSTAGGSTAGGSTAGGDAGGSTAGGDAGGMAGGDAGGMAGGSAGGDADGGVVDDGGVVIEDAGVADAGTAVISLSRSNIDFGSVTVGGTSAAVTVVVRNTGSLPTGQLMVSLSGAQATAFGIQSTTCTSALGPSGTCQVDVVFAPGMQTGTLNGSLLVDATPGGIQAVTLVGRSATPAALTVSPNPHPFGNVGLGSSSMPQTFTIRNTGGSTSAIPAISLSGNDATMFSLSNNLCTTALTPNGTCTVDVTFTPGTTGMKAATLQASTSVGTGGSATLTGVGLNPPALSANPSPGNFANTIVGAANTLDIVITNTGGVTTSALTTSVTGTNATEFTRSVDGCVGQSVTASGTCTITIRFSPGAPGTRTAVLNVGGTGVTPVSVNLSGLGQAQALLQLSTNLVDFGSVVNGAASTATINVTNRGDVPSGTPSFGMMPPGVFSVVSNTCGSAIGAGVTCVVTLSFAPAAAGSQSATFSASATPGGAPTATVQGTGIAPGALSISPTTRDFGSVVLMQSGGFQDFTIRNTGGSNLATPVVTVGGSFASSFVPSGNTCAATLTPNATCSVRITFTPQTTGSLSGFVSATSGSNTAQATLSGVGLAPAALSFTQPSTTFFTIVAGQTSTQNFTLVNEGDVASGVVTFGFSGSGASQYSIQSSTCSGNSVPAHGSCTGVILYSPAAAGTHTATLTASSMPGGPAVYSITGSAISPAALTLVAASGSNTNYGNVLLNTTQTMSFTVTNTGQQASGALSLGLSGTNAGQWQVSSGATACQIGQPLLGGQSCTSAVRFSASAANGNGMKTATLTASATPGSSPSLNLTANVQNPATLFAATTSRDYAGQEVGVASAAFTWTIQNTGDLPTSVPTFTNTNASEFVVSNNTCGVAIAAGGSCSMNVAFTPSAGGVRNGTLTLTAATGGSVSLAATGRGQWRLTIVASFSGGTVSTTDNRLQNCGTTPCSALYDDNASVTVRANPTANGSTLHFAYWAAPTSCTDYGHGNLCTISMTAHTGANARYLGYSGNLIFVSSTRFAGNLGSPAAYDAQCNALATAAGINATTNDSYVAWISTPSNLATTRLGANRGHYRRIDTELVATSETNLLANRLLVPPNLDEYGKLVNEYAWTGTYGDGSASPGNCSGWSSTSGTNDVGITSGGPSRWSFAFAGISCGSTLRIYCLQRTSTTLASAPTVPTGGKIIYTTVATFVPSLGNGIGSVDAFCNAHKPAAYSTRSFVALVASTAITAGGRLTSTSTYYRTDGVQVGTGAEIMAESLNGGPWVADDGSYLSGEVYAWNGASSPSVVGTTTSTCSNYTSASLGMSGGMVGRTVSVASDFFGMGTTSCNGAFRVICAEP